MFDEYGNQIGFPAGHNPGYSQRLNYFNMARNLFPFTSGDQAKPIKAADVIKAAREIESFLNSEVN